LRLSLSPGLPDSESIIESDSTKLNQILTNLVQNALKFTFDGSVEFGYKKIGEMLEFYVIDSGIGIPAEMKEHIFERFRQVDNSITRAHEGSGLGLSISRAYVEMLGGTIRVESVQGEGSKFFFSLPYNLPDSSNLHGSAGERHGESSGSFLPHLTILIAEDDEVSRILLKRSLKKENFTIILAGNGREAVELAERHPEIDIVLMDIKMPEMNGFEATRQIKRFRPELPVIAQTAFTSKADREKAADAGCDGFITKPISKKELFELIKELLGR
jgi:CheY-like chemotaxis protein